MLGRRVAHYRITGKLGVGGMGVVYEAEDTQLVRLVALKFLPEDIASDQDAVRRLMREAQMLARLNHPNICAIHDVARSDGHTFIVMERADGVNLRTWTATRSLATRDMLDIATQIARALEAAHANGIVHRDIKPGNVIVAESGLVKVLDFGLARSLGPARPGMIEQGSTILGQPVGTSNFMAPERIRQEPLDARSDLFSLGVILYEMATGVLPFAADSPDETVTNILERNPVPLTRRAPGAPFDLERIVRRLLRKRPDDRFQSATALLEALRTFDDGPRAPVWRRIVGRLPWID